MVGIGNKVSACAIKLHVLSAQLSLRPSEYSRSYFVILSSIDRSSRMKVGRVILDRSAPGRSCDMMCERTAR
jgi:hypothetical protein